MCHLLTLLVLGWIGISPANPSEFPDEPPPPRTIFLIGDSTVKNGQDTGSGRLWGWGHYLGEQIDPGRFRVVNRALGGRSSRTYRTEGLWDRVLADLQPGDVVLIQFGHNDGGPIATGRARASLKGVGEKIEVAASPGKPEETVHTYGWYLRQYVKEARIKGAIPIILSPVPRNMWTEAGKVVRASKDYGLWASEVARIESVPFLDLNKIIADRYEAIGREVIARDDFTATDHTHTTEFGARHNALCVAEGLRDLPDTPVRPALKSLKANQPCP